MTTETDVSFALEAKSNQLNAVDIMGVEPIIHISSVTVRKGEQPVSVHFDGDGGRPWKPSKGMLRILAGAWGRDSTDWVGKHVQLFFEPTVRYAGQEVGGIRIRALSDIDKRGLSYALAISRQKREPYHVAHLEVSTATYPDDKFRKALPAMTKKMQSGEMTLMQVIAQCQKTGQLTQEQRDALNKAAPVVIEGDDAEIEGARTSAAPASLPPEPAPPADDDVY